jgi:hypothetical protein
VKPIHHPTLVVMRDRARTVAEIIDGRETRDEILGGRLGTNAAEMPTADESAMTWPDAAAVFAPVAKADATPDDWPNTA